MWWQRFMMNPMSCSTTRMAMPVEASPRSSVANVSVSDADSPEEGSSSSSTRGWVASARATSTSRAVPVGSSSARVDATACSPRCSMIVSVMTSGRPAPVRAHRLRCSSAATRMLSRTVSDPKTSRRWNVRARPSRANWCGRAPVTSLPSTKIRPCVRLLHAGGDVEQRRLAGPVRPDEADDLPVLQVEADVVHRQEPAEADADVTQLDRRDGRRWRAARARAAGSARAPRSAPAGRRPPPRRASCQ